VSEQRRRDVLESILFGTDATPSDRLRAAELLAELEPRELDRTFVRDVAGLEGEALDRELDSSYIVDAVRAVLADKPVLGIEPTNFPGVQDALRAEIDRRAGEQEGEQRALLFVQRCRDRRHEFRLDAFDTTPVFRTEASA
jgi:hypothetical protein